LASQPGLQELVCLLAQGYVFEEAQELLSELLGVELSAKQIQRVSEHYGEQLEEQIEQQAQDKIRAPELPLKDKEEAVYVMLDGFGDFYPGKGLAGNQGRPALFKASSRVQVQRERAQVMHSLYVCHLGSHKKFLQKLEAYSELYLRKVFIADGALWIWTSGSKIATQVPCKSWIFIMPWKNWANTPQYA
jgi:hypothetical protein